MKSIEVGQMWIEKTLQLPVVVVSINPYARAVMVCGLPQGHQIVTFDDLRKNAMLAQEWGRTPLKE